MSSAPAPPSRIGRGKPLGAAESAVSTPPSARGGATIGSATALSRLPAPDAPSKRRQPPAGDSAVKAPAAGASSEKIASAACRVAWGAKPLGSGAPTPSHKSLSTPASSRSFVRTSSSARSADPIRTLFVGSAASAASSPSPASSDATGGAPLPAASATISLRHNGSKTRAAGGLGGADDGAGHAFAKPVVRTLFADGDPAGDSGDAGELVSAAQVPDEVQQAGTPASTAVVASDGAQGESSAGSDAPEAPSTPDQVAAPASSSAGSRALQVARWSAAMLAAAALGAASGVAAMAIVHDAGGLEEWLYL